MSGGLGLLLLGVLSGCQGTDDSGVEPDTDLTVVTLNLLHGLFCGADNCRLEDRVDLFLAHLEREGCPDVVMLQEIFLRSAEALEPALEDTCGGSYEWVHPDGTSYGPDDEVVLTRVPVLAAEVHTLHGGFRHALHVQLDHDLGVVDVWATHLASGSDGGPDPCEDDCPEACVAAGVASNRDCQAVELAALAATGEGLVVVGGDLNDPPESSTLERFTAIGLLDATAAAGNPECDPATGVGCTSGREDETLEHLEDPALNTDERIDFLLVSPRSDCELDSPDDDDGDGTGTRLFAEEPNPLAEGCGAAPQDICWPSDHVGVALDLDCQSSASTTTAVP